MKKRTHPRLSHAALELVAERFRLLSEPTRLRILQALQEGERSVGSLVTATGLGQANVSKQLAVLAAGGLVGRRKEGLNVYYHIADESVFALCDAACGSLGRHFAERQKVFGRG